MNRASAQMKTFQAGGRLFVYELCMKLGITPPAVSVNQTAATIWGFRLRFSNSLCTCYEASTWLTGFAIHLVGKRRIFPFTNWTAQTGTLLAKSRSIRRTRRAISDFSNNR
jgi:hypothetical protein